MWVCLEGNSSLPHIPTLNHKVRISTSNLAGENTEKEIFFQGYEIY
jgi:hypothetical protein